MLNSLISYKGIIHERSEDAPFMGALVIGKSCSNNCRNCFNQHLKDKPNLLKHVGEVVAEVKQNHFNDGLILAGLEWSEQPDDTIALIDCALHENLQVILYTGLTEQELFSRIPKERLKGIYIKFGAYDETKTSSAYYSEGVKLASTNQYIKFMQL